MDPATSEGSLGATCSRAHVQVNPGEREAFRLLELSSPDVFEEAGLLFNQRFQ